LGAFYAFSRNHNSISNKNQYPWSFDNETILYNIRKAVNYRYSLLRYIYSHLFSSSLNEKVGFFNPVFFSYPNDEESYIDIDEKAMVGDAFILFPIFDEDTSKNKTIKLPPGKWNYYPEGKILKNFEDERTVELSGELDIIHLYMRGGVIVPYQNTFDKYIQNSYYLRNETLNLIINIDEDKKAKGVIFFDNDGINTIENKEYIRIDLNYENNILNVNTTVKDGFKYECKGNVIGIIELWGESNKQGCNITINTILQIDPIEIEMFKDEINDKFIYNISDYNLELDKIFNFEFKFDE
jgi:alpha-glucosidase (family GH31 glycosyl hydrolase)